MTSIKYSLLVVTIMLFFITSCAQRSNTVIRMEKINDIQKPIKWMPYLTDKGDFVYVNDKMEKQLESSFTYAEPFTPTGFAFVGDAEGRWALIDTEGNFIIGYVDDSMELEVVGDITLLLKVREYDKKMMPWDWEWNIMSGHINKKQTYHQVEIFVLEREQLVLSADVPYDENNYSIDFQQLDKEHIVMNDILYQIQDKKLKKIKNYAGHVLEEGRYISSSYPAFEIRHIQDKKPVLSGLTGVDAVTFEVNGKELIKIDSINIDRFPPAIPKLLMDKKSQDIYAFPQYDKLLPKEVKQATASQLDFLKSTSLVYSVPNSPYFILGRFNYDHEVWAYDWMYLDVDGNLHQDIALQDFYIKDQIGRLVWPTQYMLLSQEVLDKEWKVGQLQYVPGSDSLYIVGTKVADETPQYGLWNASTKEWELEPTYYAINILNSVNLIFALQEHEEDKYAVYNYKEKRILTLAKYTAVYSNGRVDATLTDDKKVYYYIDLFSGREYQDEFQ